MRSSRLFLISLRSLTRAQVVTKHYTADKSASNITTGYQVQFPITMDQYKDNRVSEYVRDIAEEQKLGVETDYVRVRMYEQIGSTGTVYYARKFRVGFAIDSVSGAGGEIMSIGGNMNAIGDAVIGKFDTTAKSFTANTVNP